MTWPTFEIGQLVDKGIADIQTGPFGTQLKASDYVEHGVPVINVRNIGYSDLRPEKIEYITDQKSDRLSVHKIKEDDIVFGRKGAVDRHLYVQAEQTGWIQGSDCIRLRFSSPEINPRFVSYSFLSSYHKQWMLNQCGNKATMASLNQDVVKRIILKLPSKTIQDIIVDTLKQYDGLIENNLRRIELLEESARHLYKEWFVRFRFPGHEHVKIVDGVPEGWEVTVFGNVANISKGKNITKESSIEGSVPVVAGGLTPAYYHNNSNTECPVITVSASGANAGYVNLYHEKIWASDCSYIDSPDKLSIYYLYLLLKYRQNEITGMQKGAAQPHVYPKDLMRLVVCLPPDKLILQFSEYISDNFKSIQNLQNQNKFLIKARDLLLPKLMSGEIAI